MANKNKKYTFNEMLLEISIHPEKSFSSKSAKCYEQNFKSIIHLLTGPSHRLPHIILAKDWVEIDNG